MAYFVRKIARAKWSLLDTSQEDIIDNYKADTIANDIRTVNNSISLWKVNELTDESMEAVIVINSLLGDTISTIDLLIIPEELLMDFELVQEDGDTIVKRYAKLHYNLVNLTVDKHIKFANVVLKIVKREDNLLDDLEAPKYIRRIKEKTQIPLIRKWLDRAEFAFEDLKERQKEKL